MPSNARGVQSHLDYWLYGLVKVSTGLGNTRGLLRAVQEESIRKLLEVDDFAFPKDADPAEVLRIYNRHLDDRGIVDADDVAYHRTGGNLAVTIGESCPYRGTCNWLDEEKVLLPCFRAIAMGEVLRLAARRNFEGRLTQFGVPCHLTFKPVVLEEAHDGD